MDNYIGLTDSQIIENQKKFGLNSLEKKNRFPIFFRLIKKASSPLLLILLFSSLLSAALGQTTDFLIILVILFVSIVLDIFQESQAENASAKLSKKISITAKVIRNGHQIEISTREITIGDIVILSTGNIIPADCQLLEANNLEINQSVLTGESFPVEKEKNDYLLMGTHIVSGYGVAVVTAIGFSTQFGKISSTLSRPRPQTEFEKGLNNFSFLLIRVTFIFAIFLFIANLFLGHPIISSLMFVLAIAIGFAPEFLPMILTINLSKGSLRLSKKDVIVKFLPSIENFGSMDVLCTDKTGTLTEGAINLKSYLNIFGKEDKEVLENAFLNSFYQNSFKNPIDDAILSQKNISSNLKKVGEIAYDFYRRRSSVFLQKNKKVLLITKGSTDSVLPLCNNNAKIKIEFESFNRQGYRTIVVASKEISPKAKYSAKDENNLTCLGFLIFADPPKEDSKAVVAKLKDFGVDLKILTGDSGLVTLNICNQIGLEVKKILTGEEIEKMTDQSLLEAVDQTTIFASINPDQKLRIISSLKQKGHTVGYLGDGINDAPSLKGADVGISVNNAVDVAKESADIILLRKDLKVLKDGIEEGRTTFANIMKYIFMGTSSTFGNMISLSIASFFLPFLPILPAQLLLNDLLYDFSQILLVKDRVDASVVKKPYRWSVKSIKKFMLVFGSISSIFDLITFYFLYIFLKASPSLFQTGWFMESFLTQTLVIFSIRTIIVPFWKSKISPVFVVGVLAIIIFALSLPYLPFGHLLHFVSPPPIFLIAISAIAITYISLIEFIKYRFYHCAKNKF